MSENTKIEWCSHTFNPWVGCTKVSPGCAHCYAETLMDKRFLRVEWGKGNARVRTSVANWKEPLAWNRKAERTGDRPRVFSLSLGDWLDDEAPIEWLADLLQLIRATPNLDWLLLTKRPENFLFRIRAAAMSVPGAVDGYDEMIGMVYAWTEDQKPPPNVWIGTSVEDQIRADERIPKLLEIPAKVRFLSCEPLLGEIKLPLESSRSESSSRKTTARRVRCCAPETINPRESELTDYASPAEPGVAVTRYAAQDEVHRQGESEAIAHGSRIGEGQKGKGCRLDSNGIDWVICGGESGPQARPMDPAWARSLRDQCGASDVPFFMKQMDKKTPIPADLFVREFPTP